MNVAITEGVRKKIAFLVVGTTGFVIYYVIALALVRFAGVSAGTAALVGMLTSITPTFLMHKHFAFRHSGGTLSSFWKYCALQAVNSVLVGLLADTGRRMGLIAEINFFVSAALITLFSYVVLSRVVFRGMTDGHAHGR